MVAQFRSATNSGDEGHYYSQELSMATTSAKVRSMGLPESSKRMLRLYS